MIKTSENGKKTNITSFFKKEDEGNSKPLSLTSIFQKSFPNKVLWSSQHGFMKDKSCLTNLRTFHGEVMDSVNEGEQ